MPSPYGLIGTGRGIRNEMGYDLKDVLPRKYNGTDILRSRARVEVGSEYFKHVFNEQPKGPVSRLPQQGAIRGNTQERSPVGVFDGLYMALVREIFGCFCASGEITATGPTEAAGLEA
jgi:hypothetical protein